MKRIIIIIAALAVPLTLVAACGGSQEAAPAATVTKSVPAPTVTKTQQVTRTKTVTQVPKVCLKALDAGEKVSLMGAKAMSKSGAVIGLVPDAIQAVADQDVTTLQSVTEQVSQLTDEMDAMPIEAAVDRYNRLATQCRSKA